MGNAIYIFGGRDADGRDLGDLAVFKITSKLTPLIRAVVLFKVGADQRWYMFQDMGYSPRGRSGHAMASIGSKVFVIGGESSVPSGDDPDVIHVLDTSQFSIIFFAWILIHKMEIEHVEYREDNRPPVNVAFPSAKQNKFAQPVHVGAIAALAGPSSASGGINGRTMYSSSPFRRSLDVGGHKQQAAAPMGGPIELGDGGYSAPMRRPGGWADREEVDAEDLEGHGRI